MAKVCFIAFILWLFGGLVGLHHFYLGRDEHGFLWATTGGGFVIGWIKDFSKLSRYTSEANRGYPLRARRRPSLCDELHRIVAFIAFGLFYRAIAINAIPEEISYYTYLRVLISPLGAAFGTYMVANVGHISCSYKYPLIGAVIGELLFGKYHLLLDVPNSLLVVCVSMISCLVGWKERQKNIKYKCTTRLFIWGGMGVLVMGLWGSHFYYNATIHVEGLPEPVKFHKVLTDFIRSEEAKKIFEKLKVMISIYWETGDWDKVEYFFEKDILHSQLELAKRTMEFNSNTTIDDLTIEMVKMKYKELAMKWHPDKHTSESSKEEAKQNFIELQEAYKLLDIYLQKKYRQK
jgi:DnaJ family protein C protein 22